MITRRIKALTIKFSTLTFTTVLLFGCATPPSQPTSVEWQAHQQVLASINTFKVSGKLGFISPEERRSLSFYLNQENDSSELKLTTLFGQTVLKLQTTPELTQIETYEGDNYQSKDGSQLLYQLTGLTIPLEQLPSWIKGQVDSKSQYSLLPTHTVSSQSLDIANHSWTVNYKRYEDVSYGSKTTPLPSLLQLKQDQIKINLQISQWTFPQ